MTISATYIGQSTVQVSTSYTPVSGSSYLTPFMQFANTVADAITGTTWTSPATQATGAISGTTFVAAQNVTPQTTSLYTPTPSTASGWTLYDAFWGGADATAGSSSPTYTQVFRSVNKDGTTAKNIVLRYNTREQTINTTTYEYWDTRANYDAGVIDISTPTASTTATQATIGSSTIVVGSATNIAVGQIVSATGIPFMTTVTAVSGTTITLSNLTTAALSSTAITFTTTSHGGSQEAWTFFDSAPIAYNLTNCDFLIMVSPRWCILHSYIGIESSMWSGVVEMAREDIMDTVAAKYPCWGWISSTLWNLGAVTANVKPFNGATNASDYPLICMPRTRSGNTGIGAARGWGADYGITAFPTWLSNAAPSMVYNLGTGAKFLNNQWDTTRRLTLPIKPIADFMTTVTNYGQIFGAKILAPVGQNMNKVNIAVDSDGNSSTTASDRGHWLLNCHHKTADATSWLTSANATITNAQIATGTLRPLGLVSVGSVYYFFTATTISKIDPATLVYSDIVTASSGYSDIKYDGERYIYVTSTTAAVALTKIDIATDTVIGTVNVVNGFTCLGISGDTICCALNSASTTPQVYRYIRQTSIGTPAAITATTTAATPSLTTGGPLAEAMIVRDIQPDMDGNFWAVPVAATLANLKVLKIDKAGVVTAPTFTGGNIYPGVLTTSNGLFMLDGNNILLAGTQTAAGAMQYVQFNPRTLTVIANGAGAAMSACLANSSINIVKIQGNIMITGKNSAIANIAVIAPLGRSLSAAITAPILNLDWGTTYSSTISDFMYWDGCKLIVNYDTGIRTFFNFNGGTTTGGNPTSAYNFGQLAIPA